MRYVLDFGSANAGGAPTFTTFVRVDSLAALAEPAIVEIGDGQYYFDLDWSSTSATSVSFKALLAGIELSDVISVPDTVLPGATTASAGVSSLSGYSTVGVIVARAGTQCGVLNLNPVDQAAYDPFATSDPSIVQMLEFLTSVGEDLVSKLKKYREVTITTAASATSYALPADFAGMVDRTGWDLTSTRMLDGAVSSQYAGYIKATTDSTVDSIPFRIEGNRLTFPVAPSDGLLLSFEYVSEYWVQTASSGTGPDADHPTSRTDYVLFDPLLVVRGLKLYFLQAKGRDTNIAYAEFQDRLEVIRGRTSGGPTLSLSGGRRGNRFLDSNNIPDRGYGV